MQIAVYEKNINGSMVEEVGTEAFLDAGVRNIINYETDVRAMEAAAVDKFAYVEFEARYGFAPRVGVHGFTGGGICPGTNGF